MPLNLQRSTLRKLQTTNKNPLIPLRLEYSQHSKLLTNYINKLININRIFPHHLPTQKNFRWSTFDPPLTNFPRQCINPQCISTEHEHTPECWSVRDILLPDADELMIVFDHDNIEGRIGALVLHDTEDYEAFKEMFDLHTITCCNMFGLDYPIDKRNPHTSVEDEAWRAKYNWQGKDTRQRVLAKNFNHGSRYSISPRFVYTIPDVEQYGIDRKGLLQLANRYISVKKDVFARKKQIMQHIKRTKIARTLYGARRVFFDSSEHTAKEGFNHIISGTVSDYNNETLILLEEQFGDDIRLLHNAHDGDKLAIKKHIITEHFDNDIALFTNEIKRIIERDITYNNKSLTLTAEVKVYE